MLQASTCHPRASLATTLPSVITFHVDAGPHGADFALVRPLVLRRGGDDGSPGHRRRRSAGQDDDDDDPDSVEAELEGMGRRFRLRLRRAAAILDPHFALLHRHSNHSEHADAGGDLVAREARCLYRGDGHDGEKAALQVCEEITVSTVSSNS